MSDMEVGPEGRMPAKNLRARFWSILSGISFIPLFVGLFSFMPSCMGFRDPALVAVNACPAAVSALGSPITQPWIGLSYGNAETEDDDGNASWSLPVTGPNGRGSLDLRAIERSGHWQFGVLMLSVGSRTIDVLSCEAGGNGDVIAIVHTELHGAVTTIIGQPGVTSGEACSVTIDPSNVDSHNCRIAVRCGTRVLYGDGSGGYGHCGLDASGGVTMRDGNPSSVDNDPMIEVRTASNEIVVTDEGNAGLWVATLTLTR